VKPAGNKKAASSGEPVHIIEARKRKERLGREVRKDVRKLTKGGTPEVRILGQMLEGPFLVLRRATSDLQTGKSRHRGKTVDLMEHIEASSSQCWRIWDRLMVARDGQKSPGEERGPESLEDYMKRLEEQDEPGESEEESDNEVK